MTIFRFLCENRWLFLLAMCGIAIALGLTTMLSRTPDDYSTEYRDYEPLDYPIGSGVSRMRHFQGKEERAVILELGEPTIRRQLSHSEIALPLREELLNWYPQHGNRNRDVIFHEMIWKREEDTIMIWFHLVDDKWIYLNSIRYPHDVRF
ncbi:MAG: hypothetical protein L0241_14755 [Planctomycetia bacterium]|nr:hypothetical protein [Planctomycetia bacterium]